MKASLLSEADIEYEHRKRWPDLPSELNGSFIGYNAVIWPNGEMRQYRYLGEETAHTKGRNFDTVGVALAGNFTKGAEVPTLAQKMKLQSVLRALVDGKPETVGLKTKKGTLMTLKKERIYPHRGLQSNTDCYGSLLPDEWGRSQLVTIDDLKKRVTLLTRLLNLYQQLLALKMRAGLKLGFIKYSSECIEDVR